ncbi:MAG TPA: sigma-70 family RNA polymerase sigma factor [Kofleriaceae bacterium]|nr:sigma-70 family RNA polymerase sigma factor [Kofleriaceae bacterium]
MTSGERPIRQAHLAGQLARAATLVVEMYGDEIHRFLSSLLPEAAAADDAFSRWCESLWIGLPGFRWESTARVWAYALARHAWTRALRERRRDRVAGIPLSEVESLVAAADAVRARTESFLKTDAKDALAAARDDLSDDDRQLLMLRVTRKMSWLEIAHVLCEPGDELSELRRKRRAAALRKRYERLKGRLRERIEGNGA